MFQDSISVCARSESSFSGFHFPWTQYHKNLLPAQPLSPSQKGTTVPLDSPFLTGEVDSQQDTLFCVLAPTAVHHHHVPDALRPGTLQAHSLDKRMLSLASLPRLCRPTPNAPPSCFTKPRLRTSVVYLSLCEFNN